jgi:Rrf2 family protein
MISQTARYALQTLGYLATRIGTRTTVDEIARETGMPSNYLSKILNQLRKQGIVDAEKGWGGGFELRRKALKRPILHIVTMIDGANRADPRDCLLGRSDCDARNPCPLHPYWERIREIHEEMLSETRIGDLIA